MKICQAALAFFTVGSTTTDAFVFPNGRIQSRISSRISGTNTATALNNNNNNNNNINEFEYLLHENGSSDISITPRSRRVLKPFNHKKVNFVSTATLEEESVLEVTEEDENIDDVAEDAVITQTKVVTKEAAGKDKYLRMDGIGLKASNPFMVWLRETSPGDIMVSLAVPIGLIAWGATKVVSRTTEKVSGDAEANLNHFSSDMIYYTGDLKRMEECKNKWNLKLSFLGPTRNKKMISRYLEDFGKRVPISPESISSLSYFFSMFGMKEVKAAEFVVNLCLDGGTKNVASAMKLLFCCNQIFETPEAKEKLIALKNMCMKTYPDLDDSTKETMFTNSQYTMGKSGYRKVIQEKGETDTLPPGWQILGITQEDAIAIYEEERKKDFQSEVDFIYEGVEDKYNDDGQRVDDDGNLLDQKDIIAEEKKAEGGGSSSSGPRKKDGAFECGKCDFQLFVAKGRGPQLFGADYKCPTCGCGKSDFKDLDESQIMD